MKKILSVIVCTAYIGTVVFGVNVRANVEAEEINSISESYMDNDKLVVLEDDDSDIQIKTNFDIENADNGVKEIIEENIENTTGIIDSDVEEMLNSAGVLDSEIEKFTDEDIKNFDGSNEIVLNIQCGYIDEDTNETVLLDPNECGKEYYSNEETSEEDEENHIIEEDKSFITKIFEEVGILPQTVYAKYCDEETQKSSGGKFKQTAYIVATNSLAGKKAAYYKYTATWVETPKYCYQDYFYVYTAGIPIKRGEVHGMQYSFTYTETMNVITDAKHTKKIYSTPKSKELNANNMNFISNSQDALFCIGQQLPGGLYGKRIENVQDKPTMIDYEYVYTDITMSVSGYMVRMNSSQQSFAINGVYRHLKVKAPAVEITGISLGFPKSVSVTLSKREAEKYYEEPASVANAQIDVNYFK